MNRVLEIMLRRNTVLVVMVIAGVVFGLLDAFAEGSGQGWFSAAVIIFVFSALAWFTYDQQPVATWTTILVLLIKGSDLLYDCILGFAGKMDGSLVMFLLKGLAGIYLTWGALVVHRERPLRR